MSRCRARPTASVASGSGRPVTCPHEHALQGVTRSKCRTSRHGTGVRHVGGATEKDARWDANANGAFGDVACCPNCGSEEFQQRGFAVTQVQKYRRYQCKGCGTWFRGNKTVSLRLPEKMITITR